MRAFCFGRGPLGNFAKRTSPTPAGPNRACRTADLPWPALRGWGRPCRVPGRAPADVAGATAFRCGVPPAGGPGRPRSAPLRSRTMNTAQGGPAAAGVRARHAGLLPRLAPGDTGGQVRGTQRRPAAAAVDAAVDPLPARAGAPHGRGRAHLVPARPRRGGRAARLLGHRRLPGGVRRTGAPTSRRRSRAGGPRSSAPAGSRRPHRTSTSPATRRKWGEDVTLRWVLVHMVEEYAGTTGTPTCCVRAWTGRPGRSPRPPARLGPTSCPVVGFRAADQPNFAEQPARSGPGGGEGQRTRAARSDRSRP